MSTDATKWAWSLAGLRSMERLILLSLADRADEYSRCYPSIKRLEHDTCADRKTVIKTIGRLESKGLLITDKRRGAVTKYQLIGVVDSRDQPTHTSTKNGTTERSQPVPKTGLVHESIPAPKTVPVPKMVPVPKTVPDQYQKRYPTSTKNGTLNLTRTYQEPINRISLVPSRPKTTLMGCQDHGADSLRSPAVGEGDKIHGFEAVQLPEQTAEVVAICGRPATPGQGSQYSDDFETAWRLYPKREGGNPKRKAWQAWQARIRDGCQPEELIAGTVGYASYCQCSNKTGTQYVKQAATFFGPDRHFDETWEINHATQPQQSNENRTERARRQREEERKAAARLRQREERRFTDGGQFADEPQDRIALVHF